MNEPTVEQLETAALYNAEHKRIATRNAERLALRFQRVAVPVCWLLLVIVFGMGLWFQTWIVTSLCMTFIGGVIGFNWGARFNEHLKLLEQKA